jgi:hypothetical protein
MQQPRVLLSNFGGMQIQNQLSRNYCTKVFKAKVNWVDQKRHRMVDVNEDRLIRDDDEVNLWVMEGKWIDS